MRALRWRGAYSRQGANGYVLSMGTKIWDPEQTPEQGPEWEKLTFRAGLSFLHFLQVLDPEMAIRPAKKADF